MDNLWHEDEIDLALKVVIVGDGGVGKSSLIRRYCQGVFTSSYKKTIGVDFLEKVVVADNGQQVRLMLWDTAGQEEFDAITRAYYRGSNFCLLAFSTTDRKSFEKVPWWKEKVERECGTVPMMMVMNKIDLMDTALVNRYEAEDLAASLDLNVVTTSAKENVNIDHVFQQIANSYFKTTISIPARNYSPRCQVGGWRQARKTTSNNKERQRRMKQQLMRQQSQLQERQFLYVRGANSDKPRSVQRRESQAAYNARRLKQGGAYYSQDPLTVLNVRMIDEADDVTDNLMDEMWEDPQDIPLMLTNNSRLGHQNLLLGLGRESSVDSPKTSLIRLQPGLCHFPTSGLSHYPHYPTLASVAALASLHDDQDQWHSNLFSAASSPSLIQSSSRSTSRSQTISVRDSESEDSATQFLNNPMFDSIKTRRSWAGMMAGKRRAKYSLTGESRETGRLANKCSIM